MGITCLYGIHFMLRRKTHETPTEGGVELRSKVPQGNNSWDNDIAPNIRRL